MFYELGFVLGSFAILFGGSISLFAGWMLTHCSHATNGACYEEIAMASFGKKAQGFTSLCMILCNGGFVISYIVLVSPQFMLTFLKFKSFMPFSLQTATGQHLPKWCDDSRGGQAFWAVLFSVSLLNFKIFRSSLFSQCPLHAIYPR